MYYWCLLSVNTRSVGLDCHMDLDFNITWQHFVIFLIKVYYLDSKIEGSETSLTPLHIHTEEAASPKPFKVLILSSYFQYLFSKRSR